MEVCKTRSTRPGLSSMISALVICCGCSDVGVSHPISPTPIAVATQHSAVATVLSAQISPSIDTMKTGETLTFSMKLEFGEGVPPAGPMPLWSSNNSTVIRIDGGGIATAVGEGQATIEASGLGAKVTRTIRVIP